MNAFDIAIAQNDADQRDYRRQLAHDLERAQRRTVVAGKVERRGRDGLYRIRTPGGGIRVARANTSGGLPQNTVIKVTKGSGGIGLVDGTAPADYAQEDVRGGLQI